MLLALAGVVGLLLGSFIAGLSWRWPRGEDALSGRSRCASCGATLRAHELVPVLSWLVQRGRCRRCGAAVPARHLAIELAAAVVVVAPIAVASGLEGVAGAGFGLSLLLLLVLDAEHFWLPDAVVWPLAGLGLWLGLGNLPARAIGAVAGFGLLWLIAVGYRRLSGREGMGAGDPKLLGAIGAWLGWAALPLVVLGASLLGLALVAADRLRGRDVARDTMLPLGALLAAVAFPLWLLLAAGALDRLLP
ncbi:type 4 prepilin-like proteins leader peptide-processing enzyme [Polymorphobacter multimanifer]|nr:A24 family peptidase [Polymorphobacter multimanifer]GGI84079.1 type 4 prepilin-like proteins leader peptide-processing enzyme [Polymorphobacter multimanifer]